MPAAERLPLSLDLSGAELERAYAARELTPREVAEHVLARIDHADTRLHAFVTVTPDLLLQQADAASARLRDGQTGPLLGVPVSIKDIFDVKGVHTTYGSLVFRDNLATRDSGAVRRLRSAGAMFTGKTNTAEFAQSATSENRLGPDTANPWDHTLTPGGSSGGAAVSVASGMCTAALGSDGGGSLRIPAAFTGLVGLKPSAGLCRDEEGFVTMADFSSPGPLARSVEDVRRVLTVLAGRSFSRTGTRPPLRVGWSPRPEGRPVAAAIVDSVTQALRMLEEAGHRIEETELPFDGWQELFGPFVLDTEHRYRASLLTSHPDELTHYMLTTLRAARRRADAGGALPRGALEAYRARVSRFFESFDIVVTPTTAVQPFPIGSRPTSVAGEPIDGLWGPFPFTAPLNVAGAPALSLPCGLTGGLPVGIQLAAASGQDPLLLDVAQDLEEALALDLRPPSVD